MRHRGEQGPKEKVTVEEERKSVGRKVEQGTDEQYQCTGLLEQDFPELCARAGITGVPKVTPRPPPSYPAEEEAAEETLEERLGRIGRRHGRFQPRVLVELEGGDPRAVRAVFLRGWKIEEDMLGVLSQCLPALAGLQELHLWTVGLSERLLPALAALLSRCPCLRTLSLEGNPLPEPIFHTLMGSDSPLSRLSLRHNGLGDAGAALLGHSLSRASRLAALGISFNRISDRGARHIAQGLRLNRSLLSLSLANNDIGDAGATSLAEVLGPLVLSHAEVVERRRLLLERSRTNPGGTEAQSEGRPGSTLGSEKLPPAKQGRTPSRKKELTRREEARKAAPEPRGARGRDPKPSGEKPSPEAPEPAEPPHPLLDEARQHRGTVVLPGNRALLNLNLSHNRVTERGLGAFLAALQQQQRRRQPRVPGGQGLRWLSLEGNQIPASSPALARLRELLPPPPKPQLWEEEKEQDLGT